MRHLPYAICYESLYHGMDTGMVIVDKFPSKYSKAIYFQYAIGWDNFFHGKISQEWLQLYDESRQGSDDKQRYSANHIIFWAPISNIIKIILSNIISL